VPESLGDAPPFVLGQARLLQARPDFELPKTEPPKIRNLFTRIKEDIK
jgi:hypothetical protein